MKNTDVVHGPYKARKEIVKRKEGGRGRIEKNNISREEKCSYDS